MNKDSGADGSTYSLSYQWPRSRVIVHVHKELDAASARDLASSLLWFADRAERDQRQPEGLSLDADGECVECGHRPDLHGDAGCRALLHGGDPSPRRCDCPVRGLPLSEPLP